MLYPAAIIQRTCGAGWMREISEHSVVCAYSCLQGLCYILYHLLHVYVYVVVKLK